MSHHFISYSPTDAAFALRLHDALKTGKPPLPCWLDQRDLQAESARAIQDAIRDCETMLFLMSPDSVSDHSPCQAEWSLALSYKKPVILLGLSRKIKTPLRLQHQHSIDCTGSFETGLAKLRDHLPWRSSPAGVVQTLTERLKDADYDRRRTREKRDRVRLEKEIGDLKEDLTRQKRIADDPARAARDAQLTIQARLEQERKPARAPKNRAKFINPLPDAIPAPFQDRHVELEQIAAFMRDDTLRLLTLGGPAGCGKTALAHRLLRSLEFGQLPDDLGPLPVEGIAVLSAQGLHRLNAHHLAADLEQLPAGRTVLLLDQFETVIEPETGQITDPELDRALRELIALPGGVKVILTTRVLPRDLGQFQPERQRVMVLDRGLPSPDAENRLRAMDRDGRFGLRDLPEDHPLLRAARAGTYGIPRALESLIARLAVDYLASLSGILADLQVDGSTRLPPDILLETLTREAFNRLDPTARLVMQALAVYGRPVPPVAVDYLLQPLHPGLDSTRTLVRLVEMRFVRRDGGKYYLHPLDQAYALSLMPHGQISLSYIPTQQVRVESIPTGDTFSKVPVVRSAPQTAIQLPFTAIALPAYAASYFHALRQPRADCHTLSDLAPQLAEIDLHVAAENYPNAMQTLIEAEPFLRLWGYLPLLGQLHERLRDKITDPRLKITNADSLGIAYHAQGQVALALEYFEQALALLTPDGRPQDKSAILSNLGNVYHTLGEISRAEASYKQALALGHDRNLRPWVARDCINLSHLYLEQGATDQALKACRAGMQLAEETQLVEMQPFAWAALAEIYFTSGDLPAAREAIETAQQFTGNIYDYPHPALLGLIALRQGEPTTAGMAFADSLARCEKMLGRNPRSYNAHQIKGLALCGLALTRTFEQGVSGRGVLQYAPTDLIDQAIDAFRAARAITTAPGIIASERRLFDALAEVDTKSVLAGVRAAVEGQ